MRKLLLLIFLSFSLVGLSGLSVQTVFASSQGDVVVQSVPGPTVSEKLGARAKASWSWYLTRASGLVAAATLVILMLSGIGQVTGYTYKLLDPITSWASHRALGIAFGVSVLVHVFSLLFDKFVKFNFFELFIPWLSHYKPVTIFGIHFGSLYVALGVIAFYLVGIIIITSLLWVEKKPHIWKWIHLMSYVAILLVFVHALYIGTDLAHGIWRYLWIGLALTILVAAMQRLWRLRNS